MNLSEHENEWLIGQGARMVRSLGVKEGDSVIDFGCGIGRYSIPVSQVVGESGSVLSVERDPNELAVFHERIDEFGGPGSVTILNSEDVRLPSVADATVDCVFVFDVLQYIDVPEVFFASVRRVLKPGGTLPEFRVTLIS
jgi:ubiquinone/menaquinone biosynthesis C-methylase UbiE